MRSRKTHGTITQSAMARRGFLRMTGITTAVTAGILGVADVAGLSPAFADSQQQPTGRVTSLPRPASASCCWYGSYSGCNCSGCCPPGSCCYVWPAGCGKKGFHSCCARPSGGCSGSRCRACA
jgi:hypothetical protein